MGQTLSNGVYLPNEGERNCYAGLASNWQILNTAVGNIAEKAPLVHTHGNITNDGKVGATANLPLITGTGGAVQAGAFGNSANTFCEGNDSRLSDARTPVAHTHTKSDVTDLLNSNFIPSANNSYDLGSSSYQWNNLYAKNYYYNGVAWGLDKANVWTSTNTFQQNITYERTNFFHQAANPCYYLKDTGLEKGSIPPAAHTAYPGMWQDKNSTFLGYVRFVAYDTGKQTAEIRVSNLIKNGALDPTGSTVNCTVNLELQPSGEKSLIPEQNNDINLGTSTNKWKSLNGINPGALSLPKIVQAESATLDTTNWDYTGVNWNTINTSAMDGWGYIYIKECASDDYILIRRGAIQYVRPTQSATPILANDNKYYLYIQFPIAKNTNVYALIRTSGTLNTAVVYPCQGNV